MPSKQKTLFALIFIILPAAKNHLGNVVSSDSSSNGSDEEVSDKPVAIDDELGSFLWETFSSEDLHLPLSDDTDTLVGV